MTYEDNSTILHVAFTTSVEDVVNGIHDSENPVEYYELTGCRVYAPQHGIYIRHKGDRA